MNSTDSFFDVGGDSAPHLYPAPPFYYTDRPSLLPWVSDETLSLIAPLVAYWSLSLLFHALDTSHWRVLERFRIHPSAEVAARNLAARGQVVRAVLAQQAVQTLLGAAVLRAPAAPLAAPHAARMRALADVLVRCAAMCVGERAAADAVRARGPEAAWFVYWWALPAAQFFFAMFVLDTWQYFLHRLFHVNTTLYRRIHAVHHRLYVPYAYGALYNHPLEGFLFDSLGALLAHGLSGMSTRQAVLLFVVATFKTVDDHCGYRLPFDPLQFLFGNNADYHDIHHQVVGIKHNFSQPFFIHWDVILGTRMTRQDIERRRAKTAAKSE